MAQQNIFLRDEYLGSRPIPDWRIVPGLETRWHFSYALYCGRCGDIWARFVHVGARYTQLTQRPCAEHGDGRLACCSAWHDVPMRFEDDWPPAAVEYEFKTLMKLTEEV